MGWSGVWWGGVGWGGLGVQGKEFENFNYVMSAGTGESRAAQNRFPASSDFMLQVPPRPPRTRRARGVGGKGAHACMRREGAARRVGFGGRLGAQIRQAIRTP